MTVKHPLKEKACVLVPIPSSEYYGVGMYIDVRFTPQDNAKFRAEYQGITLPEFVPEDGAEIY